jgi:glyoxylase-like metal-dependent hydrolase (beta-lactamase superfamily II)
MQLINSATLAVPSRLVLRGGRWSAINVTVRYGVIDRGTDGLTLVDTGYGPAVTEGGARSRAVRLHNALLRPRLLAAGQPLAMLAARGKSAADVRSIVVTHFHPDHIANLADFPKAAIIASGAAGEVIRSMGPLRRMRHGLLPQLLPPDVWQRLVPFEGLQSKPTWTRLGLGHDIFGDGSYLAIPLPGHAIGHFGLLWREANGPVCYGADAAWTLEALAENRAARMLRALVFANGKQGAMSANLLRAFMAEGGEVRLAHEVIQAGVMQADVVKT